MSIDGINSYKSAGTSSTGTTKNTADNSTLDMNDFFKLMVAQLSNQDMYNTTDNNEYIAQMTQFSMVQALSDLSAASATSYGVSLIGKYVSIAQTANDGTAFTVQGTVDSVNFYNGTPKLVVGGQTYSTDSVVQVMDPPTTE